MAKLNSLLNIDHSDVEFSRVRNLPLEAVALFNQLEAIDAATRGAELARHEETERLREQSEETQIEIGQLERRIEQSGRVDESTTKRLTQLKAKLRYIKDKDKRHRANPNNTTNYVESILSFFSRHPGKWKFAPLDLKPVNGADSRTMFNTVVESIAEHHAMLRDVDSAAIPFDEGKARLLANIERLAEKGRVNVAGCFRMEEGATGRRYPGDVRFARQYIGDDRYITDAAALVCWLLKPELEKRLLAEAARFDSPDALSADERKIRKAELRAEINRLEYEAAAWAWKARADGFHDVLPRGPVPAMLQIVRADGPDVAADVPEPDADADADAVPADDFDFEGGGDE